MMLKEFAEYLANQEITPEQRVVEINGDKYVINAQGNADRIAPNFGVAQERLQVNTLEAVVDYVKSGYDRQQKLLLQVYSPTRVLLFGRLLPDGDREVLLQADASVPHFEFGYWHDIENLIIGLQSQFVRTDDRNTLLQVIGNLKEENVKNTGDDGVSQVVTAKAGVATVAQVKVPNPVILAPYRTFSEVKQPTSPFIYRMQSGPQGAIYEADGGAWKLQAIKNVADYLRTNLGKEIADDYLMILA